MAHVSKTICDLCGHEEEDVSGQVSPIQRLVFSVGPPQREHDLIWRGRDLCEDCRIKAVGAIKRMIKEGD